MIEPIDDVELAEMHRLYESMIRVRTSGGAEFWGWMHDRIHSVIARLRTDREKIERLTAERDAAVKRAKAAEHDLMLERNQRLADCGSAMQAAQAKGGG